LKNKIKFKKISKFKCNKVSDLIILVLVPQPPILEKTKNQKLKKQKNH
jgi:hypothetical protein